MKTKFLSSTRGQRGYALLIAMVITAVSAIVLAGTMSRTSTETTLNARNNQYVIAQNAAEAATEKVIARMRYDFLNTGLRGVTNNLSIYRNMIPTSSENSYWGNFEFSDGQGNVNRTYVSYLTNYSGPLASQFPGLNSFGPVYRVLSNVRLKNGRYDITNAVQQDVTFNSVPIFQFAIFYNSLLEFTWCATMTVNGRVHANADIYTGSIQKLLFNGTVTTTGSISSPTWAGHSKSGFSDKGTYKGNPSYSTNVPYIMLPLGTNNVHSIIDIPPKTESATSTLGEQRLYNQAQVVLLISNSVVTARVQNSTDGQVPGADTSAIVISTNNTSTALKKVFPFISTNTFTDQREGKSILATEIDIAAYSKWLSTNSSIASKFPSGSGTYPTILYVADNRSTSSSQLTAVRLKNGTTAPSNGGYGFTVATPNPLYVLGNYNCPDSHALGTTDTSSTVPCAFLSDALTILSPAWDDSESSLNIDDYHKNAATDTTVNAAILTGIVYSDSHDGSPFSGGVMNLPRLLEDWGNGSSTKLTLNTSIVNLFASTRATAKFQDPGVYYYAPTRKFSFDPNFADPTKQPPPGTPNLSVMLRSSWTVPPPNKVNYYASP